MFIERKETTRPVAQTQCGKCPVKNSFRAPADGLTDSSITRNLFARCPPRSCEATILLLAAFSVLFLGREAASARTFIIRDLYSTNIDYMEARAINNKGQVVGVYIPPGGDYLYGGWVWLPTPEYGLPAGRSFIL